jgi:predicted TIM-barrel fold metal-dependent hydrolase
MAMPVISADSHVMEPGDLWSERLGQRFGDRAPRVIPNPDRPGCSFVGPGIPPFPAAAVFAIGKSGKELREHLTKGYEACRPSGWDPVERIKDQDIDGIAAEVIYPSLGMALFALPDLELQQACFRLYNDWVAEFAAHDRKRLYAAAVISLADIDEAVRELTRCARLGMRGAMIWAVPPADRPYHSPVYDPFWAAAQDLAMPLSLHVSTQRDQGKGLRLTTENVVMGAMNAVNEVQRTLSSLIVGGVLERFPRLIFVSAENDAGWIPHFMYRLDHMYLKFGTMDDRPAIPMLPSEYVRRQIWAAFLDDPVGPHCWKLFGEDNLMWGSDFPHSDSTWPHSQDVIAKNFAGVPDAVRHKITCTNAARLYGIEVAQGG